MNKTGLEPKKLNIFPSETDEIIPIFALLVVIMMIVILFVYWIFCRRKKKRAIASDPAIFGYSDIPNITIADGPSPRFEQCSGSEQPCTTYGACSNRRVIPAKRSCQKYSPMEESSPEIRNRKVNGSPLTSPEIRKESNYHKTPQQIYQSCPAYTNRLRPSLLSNERSIGLNVSKIRDEHHRVRTSLSRKEESRIKRTKYGIPSGLRNSEETCYMNSMVQAVASSEVLIKEYETLIGVLETFDACTKIRSFVKLIKDINEPEDRNSNIDTNTENLIGIMQMFKWNKCSQQDSFQLLSCLINAMQSDIKRLLTENNMTMPGKLKILHTFSENSRYNKRQDHLGLAIPLCGNFKETTGADIKEMIDAFFLPSIIDEGPNVTQLYLFERPPTVLILHIQANEWSDELGQHIKPLYYVNYEHTLTYSFQIQTDTNGLNPQNTVATYKLISVVRHMGDASGGHYVTYRKHHQQWFLTNDEQVEPVSFNCNVVPYILIYEIVDR